MTVSPNRARRMQIIKSRIPPPWWAWMPALSVAVTVQASTAARAAQTQAQMRTETASVSPGRACGASACTALGIWTAAAQRIRHAGSPLGFVHELGFWSNFCGAHTLCNVSGSDGPSWLFEAPIDRQADLLGQ